MKIQLQPLTPDDREQFIRDNQDAFNYGALEEFGRRDDHFEEPDEIISRKTIEHSIDGGSAYRIWLDGEKVGGLIVKVDGCHGDLEILFVNPKVHSKARSVADIATGQTARGIFFSAPGMERITDEGDIPGAAAGAENKGRLEV